MFTDYRVRFQQEEHQLWKEYGKMGGELIDKYPTKQEALVAFYDLGGEGLQQDYNGHYRLSVKTDWVTIGESE